jgi:two-component system sensor histidine kinase RegB
VRVVLKYLLLLRGMTIAGQLLALIVIDRRFDFDVPWWPVSSILLGLAAVTAVAWRRLGRTEQVPMHEFVGQLLLDIAALSALVYFTGGSLNPFISLFLLPIIFAAAALPSAATAIVAGAAIAAYTALMFVAHPPHQPAPHEHGIGLHLWGMWYGFLLSAGCVAIFVARIGRALRERDAALADARANALRDERIVALGTLAAGTAHELGTPLATMAVVAQDLASDLEREPELRAAVGVLQAQIERCKTALRELARDAGQLPAEEAYRVPLPTFVENLLAEFQQLHRDVPLQCAVSASPSAPRIIVDRTLRQALLNVLNNAAEASSRAVEVRCEWDRDSLRVEVADDGPGIAARIREHLGQKVITSKGESGMGLGVYLATSAIRRIGGKVEYQTAPRGGTRVRIHLPLEALGGTV